MSGALDPEHRSPERPPKRLVVGLTGSSGPQLGLALLRALRELPEIETHLVVSAGAKLSLKFEAGADVDEVEAMADHSSRKATLARRSRPDRSRPSEWS
jgi:3-polyprenyl-4-hydroxybenzoate decarboxylase